MTLTRTSKLEAINTLLDAIGEAPVSSESNTGLVEADKAAAHLARVSRRVQMSGWHFNTLSNYPLTTDVDGNVHIPLNALKVDPSHSSRMKDYVVRGDRLYDRDNNTFNINTTVYVDMVIYLDFEDLPEAARNYITLSAARSFQEKMVGAMELSQFDRDEEARAKADMWREELASADNNMLTDSWTVARVVLRENVGEF